MKETHAERATSKNVKHPESEQGRDNETPSVPSRDTARMEVADNYGENDRIRRRYDRLQENRRARCSDRHALGHQCHAPLPAMVQISHQETTRIRTPGHLSSSKEGKALPRVQIAEEEARLEKEAITATADRLVR